MSLMVPESEKKSRKYMKSARVRHVTSILLHRIAAGIDSIQARHYESKQVSNSNDAFKNKIMYTRILEKIK